MKKYILLLLLITSNLTYSEEIKIQKKLNFSNEKIKLSGRILEKINDKEVGLGYAYVSIPEYSIATTTDANGYFTLNNVTTGKVNLRIQYVGMVEINETVDVKKDLELKYIMVPLNFKLKEVVVTAKSSSSGQSTASDISRSAIDHMQSTSLADIMALLPGGLSTNQDLNDAKQITIRNVFTPSSSIGVTNNDVSNINSFGTSIITNEAPVSNNANLQTMNPTVAGGTSPLSGGSAPAGGLDMRLLSTDNVESVEIIRGIPSVRYGDVLSGAVIINTKAGQMPMKVNAKVNPRTYEFSAASGYRLGARNGDLNVGLDYANNTNSIITSYKTYQRGNVKLLYSNRFFDCLTTNTSLGLLMGFDRLKKNPDDQKIQRQSEGNSVGTVFNTNGTLLLQKPWITNLKYVASASYTYKKSFASQVYSAAKSVYSETTTDGTVLTNKAGLTLSDSDGNPITNFYPAESGMYVRELDDSYIGAYNIVGKEVNIFAKLTGNLYKKIGNTSHNITMGVDFKTDGNEGDGKTFSPENPPYRNLSAVNATFRPRSYKDIPYVNQIGAFAEESFRYTLGERNLKITGGLRYDYMSVVKGILTPRINASLDIIPRILSIRGGYGVMAKAPSILYLHPENAYFEYINLNESGNKQIPDNDKLIITTTRVFDPQNNDLKIARNEKSEIGFDLKIGQAKIYVTGFYEQLKDGYSMSLTPNSFRPVTYKEYSRSNANSEIELTQSNPVLAKFYMPSNDLQSKTKGIEFDVDMGRFDAIRTSFSANGMWIRNSNTSNNYIYYDGQSSNSGASRTHIGLYNNEESNAQRFSTAMRATHNIPEIGFAITLTWQAIWDESQWYDVGDVALPVKYISKYDGKLYDFNASMVGTPEFDKIISPTSIISNSHYIKEEYPKAHTFNINISKELGNYMRVSFFANNMFRNYPTIRSKRTPSQVLIREQGLFFGLELSLTL